MNRIIKSSLFFCVYLNVIGNSFFSEVFTAPLLSNLSTSQLLNGFFLLVFFLFNISKTSNKFWMFMSPLLILLAYNLFASLWSPFPKIALILSFKLFFLINLFLLVCTLTISNTITKEKLIRLGRVIIVITLIGQAVGLYLGRNMYEVSYSSAGLSDNGSIISAQILFTLPLIMMGGFRKKINLMFYVLLTISILLTLRRSAFIALTIVFIAINMLILFKRQIKFKNKLRNLFLVISSIIFFFVIMIYTQIGKSFYERIGELDPDQGGTASGRYDFQYQALQYVFERDFFSNVFGEGFGYSIIVNTKNGFIPIGMHSDFLDILIGLGVVGVLLMFLFFKKIFKLLRQIPFQSNFYFSVFSFFIIILAISLFTGGIYEINTMAGFICIGFIYPHVKQKFYGKVYTYNF